MKEIWTLRWKKALIWLSGYVHFIAFAIVGGYVVFKTTDERLQKTAKTVFAVTLIFTAVEALILILSGIASVGARMGSALAWIGLIVLLAKIGIYAAGVVLALFTGSDGGQTAEKNESVQETQEKGEKETEQNGG